MFTSIEMQCLTRGAIDSGFHRVNVGKPLQKPIVYRTEVLYHSVFSNGNGQPGSMIHGYYGLKIMEYRHPGVYLPVTGILLLS
jgi:hypothetical protein